MWNFIYEKETGKLFRKNGKEVGCTDKTKAGYKYFSHKGKEYRVHRVVWEMHYGKIPDGMMIDHKDGDPRNNKLENLRLATHGQNAQNRKINSNNQYGYKGVSKCKSRNGKFLKNPWRVYIQYDKRIYTRRGFPTAEEAAAHYNEKALELFGEFARLNTITGPSTHIIVGQLCTGRTTP